MGLVTIDQDRALGVWLKDVAEFTIDLKAFRYALPSEEMQYLEVGDVKIYTATWRLQYYQVGMVIRKFVPRFEVKIGQAFNQIRLIVDYDMRSEGNVTVTATEDIAVHLGDELSSEANRGGTLVVEGGNLALVVNGFRGPENVRVHDVLHDRKDKSYSIRFSAKADVYGDKLVISDEEKEFFVKIHEVKGLWNVFGWTHGRYGDQLFRFKVDTRAVIPWCLDQLGSRG